MAWRLCHQEYGQLEEVQDLKDRPTVMPPLWSEVELSQFLDQARRAVKTWLILSHKGQQGGRWSLPRTKVCSFDRVSNLDSASK